MTPLHTELLINDGDDDDNPENNVCQQRFIRQEQFGGVSPFVTSMNKEQVTKNSIQHKRERIDEIFRVELVDRFFRHGVEGIRHYR